MNYADIRPIDVANGPGIRVSLFVSGCTHHCKECFNPETWDFAYGRPFGEEQVQAILGHLSKPYIRGLSLLGGEPFEPQNQAAVLELVERDPLCPDVWPCAIDCPANFICEISYRSQPLLVGFTFTIPV